MLVVAALLLHPAPFAILGPGGIGKTTLATSILHHAEIISMYDDRYFIPCNSASTPGELISTVVFHVGLEASRKPVDILIHHFSNNGPAILVLDNLETTWEPKENRREVEEFLALLCSVQQLALIVSPATEVIAK
jgi:Cdc6-like AAA superfamily ATPase